MRQKTKAEISREHRQLNKMKTNYEGTKEEWKIMSNCMKHHYKVFPVMEEAGNNSRLKLAIQWKNNKPNVSKKESFEKKYLTYNILQLYKLLWSKLKN